jgi:hypothetical protein
MTTAFTGRLQFTGKKIGLPGKTVAWYCLPLTRRLKRAYFAVSNNPNYEIHYITVHLPALYRQL